MYSFRILFSLSGLPLVHGWFILYYTHKRKVKPRIIKTVSESTYTTDMYEHKRLYGYLLVIYTQSKSTYNPIAVESLLCLKNINERLKNFGKMTKSCHDLKCQIQPSVEKEYHGRFSSTVKTRSHFLIISWCSNYDCKISKWLHFTLSVF